MDSRVEFRILGARSFFFLHTYRHTKQESRKVACCRRRRFPNLRSESEKVEAFENTFSWTFAYSALTLRLNYLGRMYKGKRVTELDLSIRLNWMLCLSLVLGLETEWIKLFILQFDWNLPISKQ